MKHLRNLKFIVISPLLIAGISGIVACDAGPAETAGKNIDQTVDKAGDKINDAADKVGDSINDKKK